jgi:hypothetical protein
MNVRDDKEPLETNAIQQNKPKQTATDHKKI